MILVSYGCVRVRIVACPSLTGDRVTDHATDANHSVIRHKHQSSSGIAGDDRHGHSFICQHGWWWPLERWAEENPRTRYNWTLTRTCRCLCDVQCQSHL